jgi:hypothetical protein
MDAYRDRLLTAVGGMERFQRTFDARTHYPERAATNAIESGVSLWSQGEADVRAAGGDDALAAEWGERFLRKWLAYHHAGARTMNWFITGAARFPVERNRKRTETERNRLTEMLDFQSNARSWAARRLRSAAKAAASDAAKAAGVAVREKVFPGGRIVLNKAIDRVQLVFDRRPEPEVIAQLKGRAFRWSPREGAWQRQLTQNGVWAAEFIAKSLGGGEGYADGRLALAKSEA